MAESASLSPMMEQYLRMKQSLPPDVWLFFRIGDFYEMFFEDAIECSAALGLTLTKRQTIPMCGVPYHAAEGYIGQIVKLGKRVAIADQMTTPVPGKLVEREITRIVSAACSAQSVAEYSVTFDACGGKIESTDYNVRPDLYDALSSDGRTTTSCFPAVRDGQPCSGWEMSVQPDFKVTFTAVYEEAEQ